MTTLTSPSNSSMVPLSDLQSGEATVSYKPSRFNAHTVTEDQQMLLYNSFTGHFSVIPKKHTVEVGDYVSSKGFSGHLSKVGEYLKSKGYIVESHVDEDARWDVRYGLQQFRQDIFELILLSSEDCNFRCIYCSQEFKRGSMHPDVRRGVRNLVLSRIEHLGVLQVSWFGGEPLFGFDAIEELAPFINDLAIAHKVVFHSGMTTNGYLLTPERARKLLSWRVTDYQITLDGMAIQHDAHRPLSTGGRTFEQIVDNLYAMKAMDAHFKVAVRCNFDQTNTDSILDLLKSLQTLAADDPRFTLRFHPVGKWGGQHDDELSVCGVKEASRQLVQLTSAAIKNGFETGSPTGGLVPGPSSVCYAARPYNLIVGADGKIMKCTVALDTDHRNVVGMLDADGSIAFDEDRFALWTRPYYRTDEMCNKCFFVPVCQGVICPLPRVVSNKRDCPAQKVEIQQTLKDVYAISNLRDTYSHVRQLP